MARGDLPCPICGAILGLPSVSIAPGSNVPRAKEVGRHVHISVGGTMTCANSHRWVLDGDIVATRQA
jgi:hypothetical protein